jgi:hypothetical protein
VGKLGAKRGVEVLALLTCFVVRWNKAGERRCHAGACLERKSGGMFAGDSGVGGRTDGGSFEGCAKKDHELNKTIIISRKLFTVLSICLLLLSHIFGDKWQSCMSQQQCVVLNCDGIKSDSPSDSDPFCFCHQGE